MVVVVVVVAIRIIRDINDNSTKKRFNSIRALLRSCSEAKASQSSCPLLSGTRLWGTDWVVSVTKDPTRTRIKYGFLEGSGGGRFLEKDFVNAA